jgi:hypothetical protein
MISGLEESHVTGEHNRCPLCFAALWAPPSEPLGHKRCPRCGADLWVVGQWFFLRKSGQSLFELLAELVGHQWLDVAGRALSAGDFERMLKNADSLDVVELVMELEESMKSDDGYGL